MNKRILIVSPHFPPVNAPDMQRVRVSLPYFVEAGWNVTVLTAADPTPTAPLEPELDATVPAAFAARVTLRPLVPPPELPALIALHDVGLALEQSWIVNRDLTITNKITQYLNAGLAVAATPAVGQREVLARASGAGRLIDLASPAATADALDELIGDPDRLAAAQRSARRAAETIYSWEKEALRLLALVAAALTHTKPTESAP